MNTPDRHHSSRPSVPSSLEPGVHRYSRDGLHLRYRVAGRGPLVVLQPPGWGIGNLAYEATLTRLERDFTVVYVEPRGVSAAAAVPESGPLNVAAFVDDLEALRRHLGVESFALAGHSHSGLITLHYALRFPQRLSRLLLLSPQLIGIPEDPDEPGPPADYEAPPEFVEALAFFQSAGGARSIFTFNDDAEASAFLRRIIPLYFKDPSKAAPLARALAPLTLPLRTLQKVMGSDQDYPLPLDALKTLAVPTLVISGRYDFFCPPAPATTLAAALPEAVHRVFEESGHFVWLEEPEEFFGQVIPFLAPPG